MIFTVREGTRSILIKDAPPGQPAREEPFTTRKLLTFLEVEVIADPRGLLGQHGPASATMGGEKARAGYFAFKQTGHTAILLVHESLVIITEETRAKATTAVRGKPASRGAAPPRSSHAPPG